MKQLLYCLFLISSLSLTYFGCRNNSNKTSDPRDNHSQKQALQKAIIVFNDNNDKSHKEYDINVKEDGDLWIVHFDGKTKLPGNHSMVTINKKTGEALYYPGQ